MGALPRIRWLRFNRSYALQNLISRQPIRKLALQLQQLSQKYLKGFGVTSMQGGFTP